MGADHFETDEVHILNTGSSRVNPSTEEKQDLIKTALDNIYAAVDGLELSLDTLNLTSDSINLDVDELEAKLEDVKAKLDTLNSTDFSTATNQALVIGELQDIEADVEALHSSFTGTDFATDTTLGAFKTAMAISQSAIETAINTFKAAFDSRDLASQTTLAAFKAEAKAESDETQGKLDTITTQQVDASQRTGVLGEDGSTIASVLNPVPVRRSEVNETVPGLTFVETIGPSSSYTTAWVDVSTINWLDIMVEVAPAQIVTATFEATDAADPNTTPPGPDDIIRTLTTTIAGLNHSNVSPSSFGLPSNGHWVRLVAVDTGVGGKVKVNTISKNEAPGPSQIPIAASLDNEYRAIISRAIGAGERLNGTFDNVKLKEHAVDYDNRNITPLVNGPITVFTVDDIANTVLSTAHGLVDGDAVVMTTTGTLPGGLEVELPAGGERVYFVKNATANDYQVALEPWGLAVDITDSGTGVHSYQFRDQFIGDFVDYSQAGHLFPFSINASRAALYRVEWSANGQTIALDTIANSTPIDTQPIDAGTFGTIFIGVGVVTTFLRRYGRLRYVNGPSDWIAGFDEATLLVGPDAFTGTFAQLDSTLATLSTALLTRSVIAGSVADSDLNLTDQFSNVALTEDDALMIANPWITIFRQTSEETGSIDTGSLPSFDSVGPIVAPNVRDSGWMNISRFKVQFIQLQFSCPGIKVFLLNASDNQGNNSATFDFTAPTAISQERTPGGEIRPIIVRAPFFQDWFRIIVINDSGSACDNFSFRSKGGDVSPGGLFLSLDQGILAEFPAEVTQSIIKAQAETTSLFEAIKSDGQGRLLVNAGSDFSRLLQRNVENNEKLKLDVEPTNTTLYIATAPKGTSESATEWDIIGIKLSATKNPTDIEFTQGIAWDDRTNVAHWTFTP